MTLADIAIKKCIRSWDDLYNEAQCFVARKQQWIFRGHTVAVYLLQSTLERTISEYADEASHGKEDPEEVYEYYRRILRKELPGIIEKSKTDSHYKDPTVPNIEDGLIRLFIRKGSQFLDNPPDSSNILEWMALMRHYGAPSRLLDWTFSFYVAAYFAIIGNNSCNAIWCLDSSWLGNRTEQILKKFGAADIWCSFYEDHNISRLETYERLFTNDRNIPLVYQVNPFRLNQRLINQQGIFLCPSNVYMPFEENMLALFEKGVNENHFYKLILNFDRNERKNVLRNLYRMNIHNAALFPDLEGFAKSLEHLLAIPHMLQPREDFKQHFQPAAESGIDGKNLIS